MEASSLTIDFTQPVTKICISCGKCGRDSMWVNVIIPEAWIFAVAEILHALGPFPPAANLEKRFERLSWSASKKCWTFCFWTQKTWIPADLERYF